MSNPIVSVVIPVYNLESCLERCSRYLRSQTLRNYEVIFVDDVSTDSSVRVIEKLAGADKRIRLIRQAEHRGAGAARNAGIRAAAGKYIIFLDGDDEYDNRLLKWASDVIELNKADIICFNFHRIYPDGGIEERSGYNIRSARADNWSFSHHTCPDQIMSVVNPTPWNKMYSTEFVRKNGLYFEEISSTNDITFAAVSVAAAEKITYIEGSLYGYRVGHSGTITSTKSKNLNNIIIAVTSAFEQVRKFSYYEEIKGSAAKFVIENIGYAFFNYIRDWNAPETLDFLEKARGIFGREDFLDALNEDTVNRLHLNAYYIIRDVDAGVIASRMNGKVHAALTSYPARIGTLHKVIETITGQSRKADDITLYLASEQFPNREADLTDQLNGLIGQGVISVEWCDNLMAHKKYYYALKEFDDGVVITLDDDLYYRPTLFAELIVSHIRYADCVIAARTHLMIFDEQEEPAPYRLWPNETNICIGEPSMQLLATGGAGTLYPAGLIDSELFDKETIMRVCPLADDLWLKMLELHAGVPVVLAARNQDLKYVDGSQNETLRSSNVDRNENDRQLRDIIKLYDAAFGEGEFFKRFCTAAGRKLTGIRTVCEAYKLQTEYLSSSLIGAWHEKDRILEDYEKAVNSHSFRLGRIMTWPLRKARGLKRRIFD